MNSDLPAEAGGAPAGAGQDEGRQEAPERGDPAAPEGPGSADRRDKTTPEEREAVRQQRDPVALPAAPGSEGSFGRRLDNLVRIAEERAQRTQSRRHRLGVFAVRVATQVVRQWGRDRCFEKAASLAFQSVLSVVPLLALALVFLRWSGSIDAESTFVDFLSRELIPVSREVIAERLSAWSGNISIQSLGIAGLLMVIVFSFLIVNVVENTVNAIWRSERRRSLAQKFVVFYASVTIGPFLLGTSLYQAAKFGLTEGYSGLLFSLATSFGGLFLANYFLPATSVRVKPAAVGALVSMLLFELARYAFQLYVTNFAFASYSGIYGALGLVPLWLIWIYYSWLTFLLGVEVAHATQNLELLKRQDRGRYMSLESELMHRVNGVVAARIMRAVSAAYVRGDKVMPRSAIEELFDLSGEALNRIVERLKQRDLLIEVKGELEGYVPARPPSEIALGDVLSVFRSHDIDQVTDAPRTVLDHILAEMDKDTRAHTQEIYFDRLV